MKRSSLDTPRTGTIGRANRNKRHWNIAHLLPQDTLSITQMASGSGGTYGEHGGWATAARPSPASPTTSTLGSVSSSAARLSRKST